MAARIAKGDREIVPDEAEMIRRIFRDRVETSDAK
jgi:hypothetical protein